MCVGVVASEHFCHLFPHFAGAEVTGQGSEGYVPPSIHPYNCVCQLKYKLQKDKFWSLNDKNSVNRDIADTLQKSDGVSQSLSSLLSVDIQYSTLGFKFIEYLLQPWSLCFCGENWWLSTHPWMWPRTLWTLWVSDSTSPNHSEPHTPSLFVICLFWFKDEIIVRF